MFSDIQLEEMLSWGKDLYDLGFKRPGTTQGRRAEDYLYGLVKGFGLPKVMLEDVPFWCWHPDKVHLAANTGSKTLTISPQPIVYTSFTPDCGISGEIVNIGAGKPDDIRSRNLEGKIALATYNHGRLEYESLREFGYYLHDPDDSLRGRGQVMSWITEEEMRVYEASVEAGAVGFIGVYPMNLTPYLCYEGGNAFSGHTGSIPGVGLRKSEGDLLKKLMYSGATDATIIQTGALERSCTRNIVGVIPGKSERVVQVTTHHDTMWLGATEDISGVMVVLSLAKALAGLYAKNPPEKTLAFVLEGAECLYVLGSRAYIGRHKNDLIKNLVVDLHIEHLAREFIEDEHGFLTDAGNVQPRALFVTDAGPLPRIVQEAVIKHDLRRTILMPADTPLGVPTDATAYNRAGLPVASFISPPIYWNALEDTWDKIAVDSLLPTARAYADIIERLMVVDPDLIRKPGPPAPNYIWYRDRFAESDYEDWLPFTD